MGSRLNLIPNWVEDITLLLCVTDEGVYVDSNGKPTKDIQLQWGEVPSSIGKHDV